MHPVREYRQRRSFSIRELAQLADLDPSAIVRIEQGERRTQHPRTLRKLAKALECEPQDLVPQDGLESNGREETANG